jgi:hypothetical protein
MPAPCFAAVSLKGFIVHFARSAEFLPLATVRSPAGFGDYRQTAAVESIKEAVHAPATNNRYYVTFLHGSFGEKADYELMTGMMAWTFFSSNEQWRRYVFDPAATTSVDALTETVEAALDFLVQYGPKAMSLTGLQPNAVQGEHLAALLRASSTWHADIPGWHEAVQVASEAVRIAGIDPADALFGMI